MFREILFFCVLALAFQQMMCAPLIKTDRVSTGVDDENVEMAIEERSTSNKSYDEEFAVSYLKMYGYSNPSISKNNRGGYRDELKKSIKRMQKFFKLNITGELDNETLALMNSPRCSFPDIIRGSDGRQKRYFTLRDRRWISNKLTYRIQNYPYRTIGFSSLREINDAIVRGLKIWTRHANLTISKSVDLRANLNLAFYRGDHGDAFPFDGPGPRLAHASLPEIGEIHFDDDEYWSKYDSGTNLEQTAAHEAGHALGLRHTTDWGELMHSNYAYMRNLRLGYDDIRRIQNLYGPPQSTEW